MARGRLSSRAALRLGPFPVSSVCPTCKGERVVPEKPCSTCRGSGIEHRPEEITIVIPPGIEDGQAIRMAGLGEAVSGGAEGDLYVKIHVLPDEKFRKEGSNIIMDLPVKISDALTGVSYSIETLDGTTTIEVPPLRSTDEILRMKGKGIPVDRSRRGDLLIRIKLEFPHKLSREAKEILEKLKKEGV